MKAARIRAGCGTCRSGGGCTCSAPEERSPVERHGGRGRRGPRCACPVMAAQDARRAGRTWSKALNSNGFGTQDRKSTRLNSSHGYISYAVFCLKKKKKNQALDREIERKH